MNFIKRPDLVKGFASNAMQGDYLPIKFGTNIVTKDLMEIANDNFEYGLESLEKDLQLKDLNTVLFYHGQLVKYLFERGVSEFSAYQDYPEGSIVTFDNGLWIATKNIKASLTKPEEEQSKCSPCQQTTSVICGDIKEPSKETGWCKFVTHCVYDTDKKAFEEALLALSESVDALKGVKGFSINTKETGGKELVLSLSDGTKEIIDMSDFGSIKLKEDGSIAVKNPDGSTLELPKYVASNSLDERRGFYWNTNSNKWEVDLSDLLASGSGLEVDRNGNIKIDPEYTKARDDKAKAYTDSKIDELKEDIKENGIEVKTGAGIGGKGTSDEPLTLKLGEGLGTDALGNLVLTPVSPKVFNNFDSHKYAYGLHTFSGMMSNTIGLPVEAQWEHDEADRSPTALSNGLDFNGYYISSDSELNVWLMTGNTTWFISNTKGVDSNGNIKDNNAWTKWQKLDNSSNILNEQITSLQRQVNTNVGEIAALKESLANKEKALKDKDAELLEKIQALEAKNQETCKIPVKEVGAYTLVDADNTVISTGGTISVPSGIPVGRMFTIVQKTASQVTLAGTEGMTLIPPYEGSLRLAGQNAAVTVVITQANEARLFGQTQ